MTRVCETCSGQFTPKNRHKGKRAQRFCSNACRPQSQRQDSLTYRLAHKRVADAKGKAADYACVDCAKPACDWSQTHGTDGTDVEHYEPRCRKCHAAYDGTPIGEAHGSAKLNPDLVRVIRSSALSARKLARLHGVSPATVNDVRSYRTWRHVA